MFAKSPLNTVKSKVEISQNFMAFSKYLNFKLMPKVQQEYIGKRDTAKVKKV